MRLSLLHALGGVVRRNIGVRSTTSIAGTASYSNLGIRDPAHS